MDQIDDVLYCRLDGLPAQYREKKRLEALARLGLWEKRFSVLENALDRISESVMATCYAISFLDEYHMVFHTSVGLSRLGFQAELATKNRLPREESFCTHVVDSCTPLMITNTASHIFFCQSVLTQHCGVRSYLGVPLIAIDGICLGTIALFDRQPRQFTGESLQLLTLIACWVMSELERQHLARTASVPSLQQMAGQLKDQLVGELLDDIRSPLTSILGMTSMLQQQIYGPLTTKQQDYLEIIQSSGQKLLAIFDEIMILENDRHNSSTLNLSLVDVEMLCQQLLNSLRGRIPHLAFVMRLEQRLWWLDRDKIRQMLYYLFLTLVEPVEQEFHLQVGSGHQNLQIKLGVTHSLESTGDHKKPSRANLGFAFGQNIAELHGGQLTKHSDHLQVSYEILLPKLSEPK